MKRQVVMSLMFALCACRTESSTAGTENPLGTLVECDQVIEEVFGYQPPDPEDVFVRRRRVAVVPVADPTAVTITRCGGYYSLDGEPPQDSWSIWAGTECHVSGSWVADYVVAFTPNFEVYVECEYEETSPSGWVQTYGSDRVYVRTEPEGTTPRASPLGVAVECDEVIVEPADGNRRERRHKVAYVPVADPLSVKITRCGAYRDADGMTSVYSTDCVTLTKVEFTSDFQVVVECGVESTGSEGDIRVYGFEHVYIDAEPKNVTPPSENPLGVPVECDEVLMRDQRLEDPPHDSVYRWEVAYLPVEDPTSVTITRCGEYEGDDGVSTQPDKCVASKVVPFTPGFDVFVECREEWMRGRNVKTTGHERIYYRVD